MKGSGAKELGNLGLGDSRCLPILSVTRTNKLYPGCCAGIQVMWYE